MAQPAQLLISKILTDPEPITCLTDAIGLGVRTELFNEPWDEVFAWISDYWKEHQHVPTERAFRMQFGALSLADADRESVSGLVAELKDLHLRRIMAGALTESAHRLDAGDTYGAQQLLAEAIQEANTEVAPVRYVNVIETHEDRIANYEAMAASGDPYQGGIPTGFAGLDNITMGLRPQQLITIVGEAKKGKSLLTLLVAMAAHRHGVVPMYVSFEMSAQELSGRFDAILAKVPYGRVISGQMSGSEMQRIRMALNRIKNQQPFVILEDVSSMTTVSALAAQVQERKPAILFVDGVYMMDDEYGEPKGSPQALTNITRGLKRLAQKFNIPVVATTQVLAWKLSNRSNRAITADSIGYSLSFAQDSDLILGVESDPDSPDNQSIVRVVLARSAPRGQVTVNWDWSTMTFTEVGDDDEDDDGL